MNKTGTNGGLLYEKVAVIHAAAEDINKDGCVCEVKKDATTAEKLETAFMKTNITDAWWNNEGVTKMFAVRMSEHNDR